MPIYTRTGDKGETSLFNGQRVSKSALRVEAYGTVDELNSVIGVVLAEISKIPAKQDLAPRDKNQISNINKELVIIQNDLFEIGSVLANSATSNPSTPLRTGQQLAISNLKSRVKEFENLIDEMTEKMPVLKNFILPGGGKAGSLLHFARTVCRRAERRVVSLLKSEKVDNSIIMYLNRLSDLLFTMSRFINYKEKRKEIIWTK